MAGARRRACSGAGGTFDVGAGQAIHTRPGEWVRYATPCAERAEYVAICVSAPEKVHRDPG